MLSAESVRREGWRVGENRVKVDEEKSGPSAPGVSTHVVQTTSILLILFLLFFYPMRSSDATCQAIG